MPLSFRRDAVGAQSSHTVDILQKLNSSEFQNPTSTTLLLLLLPPDIRTLNRLEA